MCVCGCARAVGTLTKIKAGSCVNWICQASSCYAIPRLALLFLFFFAFLIV